MIFNTTEKIGQFLPGMFELVKEREDGLLHYFYVTKEVYDAALRLKYAANDNMSEIHKMILCRELESFYLIHYIF